MNVHSYVHSFSMPKKYSSAEARSNLPSLVDMADAGDEVELTRHGDAVAVIISPRQLVWLLSAPRRKAEKSDRDLSHRSRSSFFCRIAVRRNGRSPARTRTGEAGILGPNSTLCRWSNRSDRPWKWSCTRHGECEGFRSIQRATCGKLVQALRSVVSARRSLAGDNSGNS